MKYAYCFKHLRLRPTGLMLIAVLVGTHRLPALELDKLLACPTTNSVRIEVKTRAGEDLGGVALGAMITRADQGQVLWQGSLGPVAQGASFAQTLSGLK